MLFRGILAPLTTPFDHCGNIYWSKLDFNVSQLLRTKLSGFVVTDRWGEGPSLSSAERTAVWKRVAQLAGDRARTVAAISGCGVAEARELTAAASRIGCSAALLEAPDLARVAPSARPAQLFFQAVADSSDLPLLAGLTMQGPEGLSAAEMAALSRHPSIAGAVVERADDDLAQAARICDPGFEILTRDFGNAVTCLAGGATAAVLAVAAAAPFHALSIEEAVRTRERRAAADLTRRALDFDRLLGAHGAPALKRALDHRSQFGGAPRLPLLTVPPEASEALALSLRELPS